MSVTEPFGFFATGVAAGIKSNGSLDVALVVNKGPKYSSAGVFTSNRVKAAPVQWSEQVLRSGSLKAVFLNSGGANACTGPEGFADTHKTAEHVAKLLEIDPIDVAVCSTGLIGQRLPLEKLLAGAEQASQEMNSHGGEQAAQAIMTTDSVSKMAVVRSGDWTVGGMAKGAGMLAPGLATMLVVITTDAEVDSATLDKALRHATKYSFDRIDSDGCMSTNDSVIVMASGASGISPDEEEFTVALTELCANLARQLIGDAEGATKDIRIDVINAASEDDAVDVARQVARSNLLKCAIHGEDPNWGRVLAAIGTSQATYDPNNLDVALNGVWVAKQSMPARSRDEVQMSGREVQITINLHAGHETATVWTNDLTAMYVHENSAYSS